MVKKSKLNLLEDENEESENKNELTINENYAQRYDNWRSKEELQRCKLIKVQ